MSFEARILIIDDEPVICSFLEEALAMDGHQVAAVSSGRLGLSRVRETRFDLVFLDIGLPDMDGFEALSEILQASPETLVVMITGDATIESAVSALKNGAYDYLHKPFRIEELKKTVKNALDHRELNEAHRQSEAALSESEERFRTLVESSLVGLCIIQNNRIIYQNPEQTKFYRSLNNVPLTKLVHHLHPDDVERVVETYRHLLSGEQAFVEADFRIYPSGKQSKNAEMRWVQCRASRFQHGGEDAILVNLMDITRAKELEHILRIKSKMISLGRVAAGIAHEIRNPLTGINSYLYTLEDLLHSEDMSAEDVNMMKQIVEQMQVASNKIESVIKRVLDFSRPGAPTMSLISMNVPMQEALNLSSVSLRKKGIEIETDLDENLPRCYGDAHLIEQVVLNLIDNAVKAMEEKEGRKRLLLRTFSKKHNIYLVISDTGPGVPLGIRDKIFDPFFTTDSDGSGIGLAISQRIINDHSGNITVNGNRWGGAEFTIELPIEKRMRR
jgi:PAS domain S-box-containing protein